MEFSTPSTIWDAVDGAITFCVKEKVDRPIEIIKASKDVSTAKAQLMKKFKLTDIQAQAILDMRLQKLTSLETQKIIDELEELKKLIVELKDLLSSEKKILGVVKNELLEIWEYIKDIALRYYFDRDSVYSENFPKKHYKFWYAFIYDEDILLRFWRLKAKIDELKKQIIAFKSEGYSKEFLEWKKKKKLNRK